MTRFIWNCVTCVVVWWARLTWSRILHSHFGPDIFAYTPLGVRDVDLQASLRTLACAQRQWTCHRLRPRVPGLHNDVTEWKRFSYYWPFVRRIHRSPVFPLTKDHKFGALMFSLVLAWIRWYTNTLIAGGSWWRHQMEAFSAVLALCVGNSSVTDEFPSQRPVKRSFLWCAPE